jgi:hypothetical protein
MLLIGLMRRRRGLLIAVTALAVLLITIGIWERHARRQAVAMRQAVAENTARAEKLTIAIDQRFRPGALESDVVSALKRDYPGYVVSPSGSATEYGLAVGQEPSDVWYCGSWTRGVKLRFESGRLVSTSIERWSVDCL